MSIIHDQQYDKYKCKLFHDWSEWKKATAESRTSVDLDKLIKYDVYLPKTEYNVDCLARKCARCGKMQAKELYE